MIHQYKLNGYNIVLDVYSGSVHAVDELAYDAIALVDAGHPRAEAADLLAKKYADHPEVTAEDINDCFDDIEELKADGKLFAEDIYADHAFDFKNRSTVVKALCLHVAHTCNLNCEYCFAAQGKFHGQSGLMSFETGKRALDFLVEHSGTRHNLEVDFFGGEPLMNFEVCKQLVAYARSIEKEKGKNFRFTLTTNGIGITDEVIEWANKECYNVVLSLDAARRSTTVSARILQATAAMTALCPSSSSWSRPAAVRATTCAAPSPITTPISPTTCSTWRMISALTSFPWSRS